MPELLALAGVDTLAPPWPKKEREREKKKRGMSRMFSLARCELADAEQFLHLLNGNWFLVNYDANFACFLRSFTKG